MKKENDEIVDLFRSRLSQAEMPVQDGAWQRLNQGVALATHRRRTIFMRIASSAAVLLVLIASSAAFWYLSPNEEMGEAFTQLAIPNNGTLIGDQAYQNFSPIPAVPLPANAKPSFRQTAMIAHPADEDSVMVSFSFSFSITATEDSGYGYHESNNYYWNVGGGNHSSNYYTDATDVAMIEETATGMVVKEKKWAMKALGGISLPDKSLHNKLPYNIGVSIERKLNKFLGIEAGVQYSNIPAVDKRAHYVGIPVKVNATFVQTPKVDLYASVGGVADKCVAGAPNNSFKHEPIQLAVTAGVGANYKMNDRLALFVEPGLSHHFKTNSKMETVRSSRSTNFNVQCGLRMSF